MKACIPHFLISIYRIIVILRHISLRVNNTLELEGFLHIKFIVYISLTDCLMHKYANSIHVDIIVNGTDTD